MVKEEGGIMYIENEKSAKDVMMEKDKSLFEDDENYLQQCEEGDKMGLVNSAINFIGLKSVNTCENCAWKDSDGLCTVMKLYNKDLLIPVQTSQKCSHWKKNE